MAREKIYFAGREVEGETLSDEEKSLLLKTVYDYIAFGNSWLLDTFKLNEKEIISTAMIAKKEFGAIKGMLASDSEVAVQLLRPGHIKRTTTTAETPSNTWNFTFTTAADYWIGFGTDNTTAVNISQYLVTVIFGAWWTQGAQPTIEEIYLQVGPTLYPIFVVRHGWLADNPNRIRAVRFHPILAENRMTVLGQTYGIAAGDQELVLVGLAMGPGRYLRKTSYVAADLP